MDQQKMEELIESTEKNSIYVESVVNDLVSADTAHMDKVMQQIYSSLSEDVVLPAEVLEKYYLELTNIVYFMGAKLESLDVRNTYAKNKAKEVYNNAYLQAQVKDVATGKSKTTVAECTSIAEGAALYESAVQDIYGHAYSVVKFKIEAAKEMIHTLSKMLSGRIAEMQLSQGKMPSDVTGRRALMEDM